MKTRFLLPMLILCAALSSTSARANCYLDRYWPMYDGDYKQYSGPYGEFSLSYSDFGYSFQVENSLTGVDQYFAVDGNDLLLLGGNGLDFDPPLIMLTDGILVNGGSKTSSTVTYVDPYVVNVTMTVNVSVIGTVNVPAGTYQNCRQVNINITVSVAGLGSQTLSAQNMVLAPFVGPIRQGVYEVNEITGAFTFVGWADLIAGNVGYDDVSDLASLSGILPPKITQQPAALNAVATSDAAFHVKSTGGGLGYFWVKNDVYQLYNDDHFSGADSADLIIHDVSAADAGTYSAYVYNDACDIMSTAAALMVTQDTTRPTLAFTAPASGARLSNFVAQVRGTAGDNSRNLAGVWYSLNGSDWLLADTPGGWTNWSANLTLQPGPNTIRAFSQDASGNRSTTNALTITYVLSAPIVVSTNGNGTVSPNYNGQLLEIGKLFTINATPGAGFAFTQWTGSVTTNRASLSFVMQSNLTFTANFVDVQKPVLTVTTPTPSLRVSNAVFTARGKATDNSAVTEVNYQLNGGAWMVADGVPTNWQATVSLLPGSNYFRAFAVDSYGNRSTTNAVAFTYVVTAPLTVNIVGKGTVAPNYNGQLLEIGKPVNLGASPAAGYALTNWLVEVDGVTVLSTNRAVPFMMQSNLVLTATFVDVQKPVLALTAPTSGQRWSNAVFAARGKVTDNSTVSTVNFQLNGDPWFVADGTTNWQATLTLRPGSNYFRAFAVDSYGNRSTTNAVAFTYVVTAPLTVNIVGKGTVSPNYNGQLLEIDKPVSLSATPASGFVLTNWLVQVDGVTVMSTNRAMPFLMRSNLVLTATFVDVQKPVLTITAPTSSLRISNDVYTARGRVTDNGTVAEVDYQHNGGPWTVADGAPTNWQATLTLVPGSNNFRAFAVDSYGNRSTTNSVNFTYVVSDILTVLTNGNGTLSPNYNGRLLEINQRYTMTATPGTGYVFSNWIADTVVTSNRLTFLMHSNFTIQANFVRNPFIPVKGTYNGLFADTNGVAHPSAGFVTFLPTDRGTYSGTLIVGGQRLGFFGQLDLFGVASNSVPRGGTNQPVRVQWHLDLWDGTDRLTGTVSGDNWVSDLMADRAKFDSSTNRTVLAGKYTLRLPGSDNAATSPFGDGYGTLTVSSNGSVQFSATLAEGTALAQTVPLAKDGRFPLYSALYNNGGSALGWMQFDRSQPLSDVSGSYFWMKPAIAGSPYYPAGFTNETEVVGSLYLPPLANQRVLNITNGEIAFAAGNLIHDFTNQIFLNTNNSVRNLGTNALALTISTGNGLFTGSVLDPTTVKSIPIKGALLQKQNIGVGFFLGTNQSGRTLLQQP